MNQNEFLNLTEPFKDRIFRLAKRLLISREEAQDATQEIYVKLWKNRSKLKKYNSIEAFAITMTKNYCFDKLKAKNSNNLKIVHSNYEDKNYDTQKETEVNDAVNWVFKLMNDLPEQQRLILQMRDVENYDNKEIADQLNMKETTVRVVLSRARKTIRKALLKKHNYGIENNRKTH